MTVAPSENGDDGQTADDDDLQNEDGRPHDPVEGDDARAVVFADVASLRAGQALECAYVVVGPFSSLSFAVQMICHSLLLSIDYSIVGAVGTTSIARYYHYRYYRYYQVFVKKSKQRLVVEY